MFEVYVDMFSYSGIIATSVAVLIFATMCLFGGCTHNDDDDEDD